MVKEIDNERRDYSRTIVSEVFNKTRDVCEDDDRREDVGRMDQGKDKLKCLERQISKI